MKLKKIRIGKTLFWYLLLEILLYCFVVFLFFFAILFVNNILVNIQDNLIRSVSISLILKFFLYSIPIVIANTIPYSALVGTLMCLGRLVADYEFLALNSLGVCDRKILKPVMVAALFISLLNFFLNDYFIPVTAPKLNDIYMEMVSENPAMQVQSYAIKRADKFVIASGEVSKKTINNILIIDKSSEGQTNFLSSKKSNLVEQNSGEVLMSLETENPRLLIISDDKPNNFDYAYGEKITYNFLLSDMQNFNFFSLGPGQLSSFDLIKKIKELREDENTSLSYLNWYNLELQKKFSIPFGTLFFVFLAYTLSRHLRTYNQGVGFVIGLLISVCYWAVLMLGQTFSVNQNFNSTITSWLPNVILLVATGFFYLIKS